MKKKKVKLVFGYKIIGPEVIKLFSCSTQLSRKFQLLIKTKLQTNKEVSCFKSLRCCIYHANNVKMPTISCSAELSMKKSFITLGLIIKTGLPLGGRTPYITSENRLHMPKLHIKDVPQTSENSLVRPKMNIERSCLQKKPAHIYQIAFTLETHLFCLLATLGRPT